MAGQLRMTEEEKKAKMKIKYDQELEDIVNKAGNKGINLISFAKKYGTEVELSQ